MLELPFPIAGPLPVWRAVFAWFGLVPLLWVLLSPAAKEHPRPLRSGFLLAYACGFLWYVGNCYWIYDTMLLHGDLPPVVSVLLMAGFSAVLPSSAWVGACAQPQPGYWARQTVSSWLKPQ